MDALPGIVDGARKTSQGGKSVRGRLSSLPEAATSRNQCMSAVTSVVHHSGRGRKVSRAQPISELNVTRLRVGAMCRPLGLESSGVE